MFAALCAAALSAGPATAADATDENPGADLVQTARFVRTGFRSNVANLRTAVGRAPGRMQESFARGEQAERDVLFFFAIDSAAGRIRVERTDTNVRITAGGELKQTRPENQVLWVSTPEHTMYRASGGTSDVIIAPAGLAHPKAVEPLLDPRTIAYCAFLNLSTPYAEQMKILDGILFDRAAAVESDADEVYRIDSEVGSGDVRFVMWFSARSGYMPIRTEAYHRHPKATADRLILEIETAYERHGDVWVPKSCRLVDNGGLPRSMELTFEWESVNEEIAEKTFTWQGLELAADTNVVDITLGKSNPVIVATIGSPAVQPTTLEPPARSPDRQLRWWIVAANVFVLFVVAGLAIYWRLRRKAVQSHD